MLTGVRNRTLSNAPFEYSPTRRCMQGSGAKTCVHTSRSATVSCKRGYRRAEHNRWGGVVAKGHHAHREDRGNRARACARANPILALTGASYAPKRVLLPRPPCEHRGHDGHRPVPNQSSIDLLPQLRLLDQDQLF